MGLMPEIERVWITIDQNLFLWNYLEGYVLDSYRREADPSHDFHASATR